MNELHALHDRIFSMFALGAVGDALGAPPETMTADAIAKRYGRLTAFVERTDHKFGPLAKGETTDDTQLKIAIARSITRMRGIDLEDVAREHVVEMQKTTRGWGGSTRQAVLRLAEGVHWSHSGSFPDTPNSKRGKGNGVAMKIDPVGAYCALEEIDPLRFGWTRSSIMNLAFTTHATTMGVASGLAQVEAIYHLLTNVVLRSERFVTNVVLAAELAERAYHQHHHASDTDRLSLRLCGLRGVTPTTSDDLLRSRFGNGDCYVYESLPLAYALFLRKPCSVEALYDAVNFGGDTDTVASIVGSLLGAYNGSSIIPQELWADVDRRTEIVETVAEFIRTITP